MLQRILGAHSQIYTHSEPWIMLHPIYAMNTGEISAAYDSGLAGEALKEFISILPSGVNDYISGIRRMYSYLYSRALEDTGKQFFLDKTPRYYFIIPQLYRIFPEAHFIILLRNPVGVLSSIMNSWVKENYYKLFKYRYDLIYAPHLILNGIGELKGRSVIAYYENIVSDPYNEIEAICRKVGVEYEPEMIDYGTKNMPMWKYGDARNVYDKTRPSEKKKKKWREKLNNAQIWRFAKDYVQNLGRDTVEEMGYSYNEIKEEIDRHEPELVRRAATISLAKSIEKPELERTKLEKRILRRRITFSHRGLSGTVKRAFYKLLGKV